MVYSQTRLGYAIGADLGVAAYERILHQPYQFHLHRNSSEIISGIAVKTRGVASSCIMPVLTCVSSLFLLGSILFVLLAIHTSATLVTLAVLASVYLIVTKVTKKQLAQDSRAISQQTDKIVQTLQEGLGGIRDILLEGNQQVFCRAYEIADIPLRRAQTHIRTIEFFPRFMVEALGTAFIALLALRLSQSGSGITGAVPIFGALVMGVQRLAPVLHQFYAAVTSLRGAHDSLSAVLGLLEQPLTRIHRKSSVAIMNFACKIEMKNLGFRYMEKLPWVLRGVNFSVPKGEIIGLVGPTGAGKSTLVDIFMGLLSATEGEMQIDGVTLTPQNCLLWQRHISHVPQTIFLTDSTIAENIAFGVPRQKIDLARVKSAASAAQISTTVDGWTEGYATRVGERGVMLSGGQRQRLGIARALYRRTDALVLDEATSALDDETEKRVMEGIYSLGLGKTILIVAHRQTTLSRCREVLQVISGSVCFQPIIPEVVSPTRSVASLHLKL